MDIVVISNLYPPEIIGGAEKHASEDCQLLAERGNNVSVITTGADASFKQFSHTISEDVDVYRFKPLNMYAPYEHQEEQFWKKPIQHTVDLWNPHCFRLIRRKLHELNPDIIHIHNYSGLSGAVFSAAGSIDAPVVHTLHDYGSLHVRPDLFDGREITEPGLYLTPYWKYNNHLINEHVDQILSPSQFVITKYNEYGMFEETPCKRLPLGIASSTEEFEKSDSGKFDLLFVGQNTHAKGVDILIDAVKGMDRSDISLDILGKGPEKEILETKAAGDRRIIVHGYVSTDELEDKYRNADFTIVPSRWYDNSPMVIYESYSKNTPVIGANIGGIPELIDIDRTGYLFEPEDADDLRRTIEANLSEADRLKENLLDVQYDLADHVSELESIYSKLQDS